MLNSTKTWQEEFDERFPHIIKNLLDEELRKYPNLTNEFWEAIKQFISDLIAKTREETIREVLELVRDLDIFGYPAIKKEEYKEMLNDILNKLKK